MAFTVRRTTSLPREEAWSVVELMAANECAEQ